MEKKIITFTADEQSLRKTGGIPNYASNKVSYIEAQFELGENWQGFDAVRAIWYNKAQTISMVLANGKCIVPYEVLANKGQVMVNLVGSISENDVLTDRLTTYPVVALIVDADAKVDGSNTYPITPSQFEQFVEAVKADAESASESAESASASAESASASAESAHDDKIEIEQKIAEVIQQIEDFEQVEVVVNTLPAGSQATSDFTDGVLTLGIPQGAKGDTGNGISSCVLNPDYTLTINFTDGTSYTTASIRGETGATGNGIESITLTSTSGAVKTYTILFTDGTSTTFDVTDGEVTNASMKAYVDPQFTDLKSELNAFADDTFEKHEIAVDATSSSWRLKADGLSESNSSYKILKYKVTAGQLISVVSDDKFQFQNSSSVPSSGTSNRIGNTYGQGKYVLIAPSGATYLIISTVSNDSIASAYECVSINRRLNDKADKGSIGFNIWDEQYVIMPQYGGYIKTKNFIEVLPSTDYYINKSPGNGLEFYDEAFTKISTYWNSGLFTTPATCKYIKFGLHENYGTTYNHDVCLNISQPDTSISPHNGEYVPYGDLKLYNEFVKSQIDIQNTSIVIEAISESTGFDSVAICTIANGTVPNAGNADCVNTSNYIGCEAGKTVMLQINKPLNATDNRYVFGYVTYDSSKVMVDKVDVSKTTTDLYQLHITDPSVKYIRFSIGEIDGSDDSWVTLRYGDFASYETNAYVLDSTRNYWANSNYLMQSVNLSDVYLRNFDKLSTIVNACRYNKLSSGSKDFMSLIITDSHNDHIAEYNSVIFADQCDMVDTLIHCGDLCVNDARDFEQSVYQKFVNCEKPFYFVVGNHDVGNTKVIANSLSTADCYTRYIAPLVTKGLLESGEYEEGKCYYYHDFDTRKTRLVVVYEYDDPNDVDPLDSTKYRINRGYSVVGKTQAEWFCEALATTPSDYNVIVAMHQPFSNFADTLQNDKFTQTYRTNGSGSQRLFSTDLWADAINAYVNRTSYTCNMICTGDAEYLNTNDGKYYTFTYDFSSATGSFMALIGGHVHQDLIWKHQTYNEYQVTPICATTGYANSGTADIRRTWEDGIAKDSLTAIGFDADNKKLRLVKVGVNVTEDMTLRDMECLDIS